MQHRLLYRAPEVTGHRKGMWGMWNSAWHTEDAPQVLVLSEQMRLLPLLSQTLLCWSSENSLPPLLLTSNFLPLFLGSLLAILPLSLSIHF